MGKKRERVGGLRTGRLDPAVREWLNDAAENPAALTAKQRWDRKRIRAVYDLPKEIIQAVAAVARYKGCSASNVAAVLLMHGLKLLDDGDIDINAYKTLSRVPRFEIALEISDEELMLLRARFLNKKKWSRNNE